jgi:hypothetical protein
VAGTEVPVVRSFGTVEVRGRIDLLYSTRDGAHVIADFKSSLQPARTPLADPMLAMRIYDLLLSERYTDNRHDTSLELLGLRPPVVQHEITGPAHREPHRSQVEALIADLAEYVELSEWLGRVRPSCQACAFLTVHAGGRPIRGPGCGGSDRPCPLFWGRWGGYVGIGSGSTRVRRRIPGTGGRRRCRS